LCAAVPVVHERDVAVFPVVLEARAWKGRRRADVVFLADREVRIPRGRVKIVVAILVMQPAGVSKLLATVKQCLHACPSPGLRRRRQSVGSLAVVSLVKPA